MGSRRRVRRRFSRRCQRCCAAASRTPACCVPSKSTRGSSDVTPDAIEALERAGFSRRDFLKTSGALVVSFSAAALLDQVTGAAGGNAAQGPFDTGASHVDPKQLDSWIAIAADGT